MPLWRLFYHLVWATRDRVPFIDAASARTIERAIRATCHEHRAVVHAVGIMPDHVHLALSIPPSIAISTFVGRVKGSTSHLVNRTDGRAAVEPFAWQAEYGIHSFGERALPDVVAYVANQQTRHAANRLSPALEPTTDRSQPPEGLRGLSAGASAPRHGARRTDRKRA